MKINFDSLFNEDTSLSIHPSILNSTFIPQSTHKTEHLNSTLLTQDNTPETHRQRQVDDYESVRRILELKLALALQDSYAQEETREPVIKLLKRKSIDMVQFSNKMYQPEGCSKKQCLKYRFERQLKEKQDRQQPKSEKNGGSSNLSYNRLYNLALMKQQRRLNLSDRLEEERRNMWKKTAHRKSKYLQNYVPFYERLEDEIRRSKEKYKILTQYSTLVDGNDQNYFKPARISKKYKNIPSRYDKAFTHRDNCSYLDDIHSSLNTSLMSVVSLDKSIEIVSSIQEYFFSKMKTIFLDKNQDNVQITPKKIDLLSDCEFNIIQNFIKEIEEKEIKRDEFQWKLRDFYNALSFNEKQQLRTHQRKAKKVEYKQKKTQKTGTQSCVKLQKHPSKKPVSSKDSRYHKVMSDFV